VKRVLVIEDDKDIRESLVDVLELEGFQVIGACHGREGLERLRSETELLPDAVIVDLMMPVMNGMEFRAAQLADPRLAAVPLIVMSADNRAVERSQEMRSAVCIRKPLQIEDLLSALDRAVSGSTPPAPIAVSAAPGAS
jgi:CheY-like chemotaxis protein